MFPQTHSHIHYIVFFDIFQDGSVWDYIYNLPMMVGGVNLKSIYLELLNQWGKYTLNIKHVLRTVLGAIYKADWGKENQW